MEMKKDCGDRGTTEAVLKYLLRFGKENKFRLARVFKIGTEEVVAALSALENEGKIEMERSKAKAKPITKSRKKELVREAENVEVVEAPQKVDKKAEESENEIGQWLADMSLKNQKNED